MPLLGSEARGLFALFSLFEELEKEREVRARVCVCACVSGSRREDTVCFCGCMCVSIHTLAQAQMAAAQRGLGVVITECEAHYLTRSNAVCRVSVLLLLVQAMN